MSPESSVDAFSMMLPRVEGCAGIKNSIDLYLPSNDSPARHIPPFKLPREPSPYTAQCKNITPHGHFGNQCGFNLVGQACLPAISSRRITLYLTPAGFALSTSFRKYFSPASTTASEFCKSRSVVLTTISGLTPRPSSSVPSGNWSSQLDR